MEMLLLTVTKWQFSRSLDAAYVFDNDTCSGGTDPSFTEGNQKLSFFQAGPVFAWANKRRPQLRKKYALLRATSPIPFPTSQDLDFWEDHLSPAGV